MSDIEALEQKETVEEEEEEVPSIEKPKKVRSEAQKAAFANALLKRDEKRKERMETKNTLVIEKTKVKNDKTIKKAILLKKKEMRANLLDEYEDDDPDIDDDIKRIREKIEKKKNPPVAVIQKPLIIFR
jgi:hypothetical protein